MVQWWNRVDAATCLSAKLSLHLHCDDFYRFEFSTNHGPSYSLPRAHSLPYRHVGGHTDDVCRHAHVCRCQQGQPVMGMSRVCSYGKPSYEAFHAHPPLHLFIFCEGLLSCGFRPCKFSAWSGLWSPNTRQFCRRLPISFVEAPGAPSVLKCSKDLNQDRLHSVRWSLYSPTHLPIYLPPLHHSPSSVLLMCIAVYRLDHDLLDMRCW